VRASIDISLYPLREAYGAPVRAFIDRLEAADDVDVVRGDLSTQVFGDFDRLMELLRAEIPASWEAFGKGVFVLKILRDDLRGLGEPDGPAPP
jgi:uncharacterized protein YqgV (UPF0045/DUF77 family)